ncbi:MAG: polysaccharide deacetylase family protein, partial [Opitutales bacterium]
HSFIHAQPATLSDAELTDDVVNGAAAIGKITGTEPKWYWPPYIALDPRLADILSTNGMQMANCSTLVGSMDYDTTVDAATIKRLTLEGVKDGSLLLFHEWRNETLDQMPSIIEELRKMGCVFLTYDEMDAYLKSR